MKVAVASEAVKRWSSGGFHGLAAKNKSDGSGRRSHFTSTAPRLKMQPRSRRSSASGLAIQGLFMLPRPVALEVLRPLATSGSDGAAAAGRLSQVAVAVC